MSNVVPFHPKSPKPPMTRMEAYERAVALFGQSGVVGVNPQYPDAPCYVGSNPSCRGYVKFGAGATWDEAFENVQDVERQLANGRFVFKKKPDPKDAREGKKK